MNTPCFPFDPVERLATEISNLRRVGFDYKKISRRLFSGWVTEYEKYPGFHSRTPSSIYRRTWRAVEAYYGRSDWTLDGGWSDYIGWIYTDQEYAGEYYEQVIYPRIKKQCDIFTRIALSDRKERLAYPEAQE